MNDSNTSVQGRRDFLGTIGLVLTSPLLTSVPASNDTKLGSGANYSGSLRQLTSTIRLEHGWQWNFDALIESEDQPPSEWIRGPHSRLSIAMDWCSLTPEQIASSLKAHGVRAQCEIDYSHQGGHEQTKKDCFVEIAVCNRAAQTRELWKRVEACQQEWELKPSSIAGEAMYISEGGNAIAGKTWFVRANILASVVAFYKPQENSARFAAKLDEHIRERLREL